ncbi:hypothetical protein GCM10027447_16750 [Glycomyces halotolerans]
MSLDAMTEAQRARAEARELYRASLASGDPLTGAQLAERFGRRERWGQERIAEAKAEARTSPPVPVSPAVPSPSLPPVTPPRAESAQTLSPPAPYAETAGPVSGAAETARDPQGPRRPVRVWPVWLLLLPAAVAIWSGWVGLGEMAGFGEVRPLPGIADGVVINSAITLPIGMEVYAAYALYVWLSGRVSGKALVMARRSAVASLVVGAAGQVAYHLLAAAGVEAAPWWITAAVACLPVAVVGMGATLAHLVKAEAE